MRIGLNLLYLIPNVVGGTQTYAVSLIKSLARIDRENEYFIFLNQESDLLELVDTPNFHRIVCQFRATRRVTRYLWEQMVLPFQLRDYHLDLVHSLGYVGPLITSCPSIVTIPDLNYITLRRFIPWSRRSVLRFFSTQSARRSTHVITISNFSKSEIMRFIGLSSDAITVTHLGPGWTDNGSDDSCHETIRRTYHLPDHYIAAFGGHSPHKNTPRLIAAFREIAREFPHSLVLLGNLSSDVDLDALRRDNELPQRIVTLGYIPREHIGPVLGQADLFVLPSLYEGFGMPVLEAQSSKVPIVCSIAGSLPEVAGDGAVFFNPSSAGEMAQVMRRVLSDEDLQASLREKGERNVKRFSWENTAKDSLDVYRRVCSQHPSRRNP